MIGTKKLNCWEFKKCGRTAESNIVDQFGVCPAYTEWRLDGIHGGRNAGRSCWTIAGTMCDGKIQGTFAAKVKGCGLCDFFRTLKQEEGKNLMTSEQLLKILEIEQAAQK